MPTTPITLLERLRQPSCPEAWRRFVQLYTPLLYYWARRSGFPRDDADDLVQDVFAALVRKLPLFSYDPHKSFRGWLHTVARNQWATRRRRQAPGAQPLDSAAAVDDDADPAAHFWEEEYRSLLSRRALQLMQTDFPDSWAACHQVIVEGRGVPEVAAEYGMTANALHQAKYRLIQRLRQELAGLLD